MEISEQPSGPLANMADLNAAVMAAAAEGL